MRFIVLVAIIAGAYLFKGNIKATIDDVFEKTAVKDEGVKQ